MRSIAALAGWTCFVTINTYRAKGERGARMIRHILSDGREVESIAGFVIPPTGPTATAYHIVEQFARRKQAEATYSKEVEDGKICGNNIAKCSCES